MAAAHATSSYVKEAKVPNIDWNSPIVQVVQPCAAQWNTNGTITMQSFSTKAGCTDYNFLSEPLFAPSAEPAFSGQIRTMSAPNADVSLNKTTRIRERTSVQFRAEVFNVAQQVQLLPVATEQHSDQLGVRNRQQGQCQQQQRQPAAHHPALGEVQLLSA